jgi:hypothetical protein
MAHATAALWPDPDERFFRDRPVGHARQVGPTCVATSLAILTGADPRDFVGRINTQDPVSWSDALAPFGMKLAYVPTDVRRLRFYVDELIGYDDLFTLGFYTLHTPDELLADPDPSGWLCGSHMVVLHRDRVFDPNRPGPVPARDYDRLGAPTKRVFRVVPADHRRGL